MIYTYVISKCNDTEAINDKCLWIPILWPSGVSTASIYPYYILFTCLIDVTFVVEASIDGGIILRKWLINYLYVNLYNI